MSAGISEPGRPRSHVATRDLKTFSGLFLPNTTSPGSVQSEHCEDGGIDTPRLFRAQVAGQVAQPRDVDRSITLLESLESLERVTELVAVLNPAARVGSR